MCHLHRIVTFLTATISPIAKSLLFPLVCATQVSSGRASHVRGVVSLLSSLVAGGWGVKKRMRSPPLRDAMNLFGRALQQQ